MEHGRQSQAAIARALGMERKTIRRWLRSGQFPERKPPHRRPPKVNEFAAYLQQRWDEGCHNAAQLYREIREKGYLGKRAMLARLVAGWRKTGKSAAPKAPERISPKHAAILVTRAADQMTEAQQTIVRPDQQPMPRRYRITSDGARVSDSVDTRRVWETAAMDRGSKAVRVWRCCPLRLWPEEGSLGR